MSQAREILSGLTKQHASGKDGYEAAIEAFSLQYKEDSTIVPTDWAELNAKQQVCHTGGYLVAHKGFSPTEVYSFANAISAEHAKIDLSATKPAIVAQLKALDEALNQANTERANQLLALGDTTDKHAKALVRTGKELIAAYTATPTIKSEILVRGLIKELVDILPVSLSEVLSEVA